MFWGKNPWQSHGFPQARRILKEIANDPARTLIVVDPRRTESADLADIHLRPRPGGDADLSAALLAMLVDEDLLADRMAGRQRQRCSIELIGHLRAIDIAASCDTVPASTKPSVRNAARVIGKATGGVSIYEDLGIQMAPHSTLNSYLEKLVVLLTGNFGVPGGMNLHSHFVALLGGGAADRRPGDAEPGHAGHRASSGHRTGAVQRDPRRDPHRPSRPLPGDAGRVRQPGALARRQPAGCARRCEHSTSSW